MNVIIIQGCTAEEALAVLAQLQDGHVTPAVPAKPWSGLGSNIMCPVCGVAPGERCHGGMELSDSPVVGTHVERAIEDPDYQHIKRWVGSVAHAPSNRRADAVLEGCMTPYTRHAIIRAGSIETCFKLVYRKGLPAEVVERFCTAQAPEPDATNIGATVQALASVLACLPVP